MTTIRVTRSGARNGATLSLADVVRASICDVCNLGHGRPVSDEDRAALPNVAGWITMLCPNCRRRLEAKATVRSQRKANG